MRLALDTCVLGKICHPAAKANHAVCGWFDKILASNEHQIYLPQIVDYELRREYLRMGKQKQGGGKSLERLNFMVETFDFVMLDSLTMQNAAELWAEARSKGKPTDHEKSLDGDVILAAQALSVRAVVVTENIKDLSRYVETKQWVEITS
jgi:predicted nucleic acid-binding protein